MKRAALIIGAPDNEIPGVNIDLVSYHNYLLSALGGAWREDEIATLVSPSRERLNAKLQSIKSADYSFVVFAGHGAYSRLSRTTKVQINPNTSIDVDELKFGAPRRTVIVDACRVHVGEIMAENLRKAEASLESISDPVICRRIFDLHLQKCPHGLAALYSCGDGEGAAESASRGGLFSDALLREALVWGGSLRTSDTVLSVSDAFTRAEAAVIRSSGGEQHPDSQFMRTTPRFPFAVRTAQF